MATQINDFRKAIDTDNSVVTAGEGGGGGGDGQREEMGTLLNRGVWA